MCNISTKLVDLAADRSKEIYEIVNWSLMTATIALVGVLTNIINIVVFYKQGFHNTVIASFVALAISDMCSLTAVLWFCVLANDLFATSYIDLWSARIMYLTAGVPHICFASITRWITLFITAERCLCIAIPLKIRQMVTPRISILAILVIYVLAMASCGLEHLMAYCDWEIFVIRNMTLLGLHFTSDHANVKGLIFCLYSVLGFASFLAVFVFTVILVVHLNRKTKWRMKANIERRQFKSISNRDRKTMSMVAIIATVFIVCYTPGVAMSMVTFLQSELSIIGDNVINFLLMRSLLLVCETFNSSISIFFYYQMSMHYRETFHKMCTFRLKTLAQASATYGTRVKHGTRDDFQWHAE